MPKLLWLTKKNAVLRNSGNYYTSLLHSPFSKQVPKHCVTVSHYFCFSDKQSGSEMEK